MLIIKRYASSSIGLIMIIMLLFSPSTPVMALESASDEGFGAKLQSVVKKIGEWLEPAKEKLNDLLNHEAVFKAKRWVSRRLKKAGEWLGPKVEPAVTWIKKQWGKFEKTKVGEAVSGGVTKVKDITQKIVDQVQVLPMQENQAVIYLKNGSAISCVIVSEDANFVVAKWQGGTITFNQNEIATIERKRQIGDNKGIFVPEETTKKDWEYENNPVIQLKNQQIIDAQVKEVRRYSIILQEDLGQGAYIDHEIEKRRIESLLFKPVRNIESDRIEERLRSQFPKMRFYRDGMVTLVTDSSGSSLKIIKKVIRDQTKTLYLEFPELFRNRQPLHQHYVVVFDSMMDYYQIAITDGIPPWACPGYFAPTQKVLFMMNYIGDEFTDFLYEAVTGVREVMDAGGEDAKKRLDRRYHAQIDGIVQDVKVKWENAVAFMRGLFMRETLVTLRHEITHEFFHNWGVQTIVVSKMKEPDEELIEKKRKLLETDDPKKKRELITEILGMRRKESKKEIQIEAANSWFVEGLAEYASTSALGDLNKHRLFVVKEARRKSELLPIEHLTVYKMGSFLGVADEVSLSAYAQSWSLVDFLMNQHRDGFIRYLERMAQEQAEGFEDIQWLLDEVNKGLRELEAEWHAYIDSYEEIQDPQIEQWFRVREILGFS